MGACQDDLTALWRRLMDEEVTGSIDAVSQPVFVGAIDQPLPGLTVSFSEGKASDSTRGGTANLGQVSQPGCQSLAIYLQTHELSPFSLSTFLLANRFAQWGNLWW